jgi:hypothetical protein
MVSPEMLACVRQPFRNTPIAVLAGCKVAAPVGSCGHSRTENEARQCSTASIQPWQPCGPFTATRAAGGRQSARAPRWPVRRLGFTLHARHAETLCKFLIGTGTEQVARMKRASVPCARREQRSGANHGAGR